MGRGATTVDGSAVLYGKPLRRYSSRSLYTGWSRATVELPYPKNLAYDKRLITRLIAHELVPFMEPYEGANGDQLLENFIANDNPLAAKHADLAIASAAYGEPLRAFVIEELPEWTNPPSGYEEKKYGEHLAAAHYVYDAGARQWHLLARHGRGIYGASLRPYANAKTALQRISKLIANLCDSTYRIAPETVPPKLRLQSMNQARKAGLVTSAELASMP